MSASRGANVQIVNADDRRHRVTRARRARCWSRPRSRSSTTIPVYCYHTKLGPAGLCRICLVEIEGMPKLQIACNTPVADGMVVHTQSDKVERRPRARVLELLLLNHPLDCPICDKGGECDLQDYAMAYGQGASRTRRSEVVEAEGRRSRADDRARRRALHRLSALRALRRHHHRRASLVVKDRGAHDIIATATGEPYRSRLQRQRDRTVPGRRADLEDVPLQVAPVGSPAHDRRPARSAASAASMHVDVRYGTLLRTMAVGRRRDLRRLAVRSRPLQRRLLRRSPTGIDAAALPQGRRVGADRLGRRDRPVGEGDSRRDRARAAPRASARSAAGGLLNEEAYLLQHVFRALGVENLDWRGGRAAPSDARRASAGTLDATRKRAGDRRRRASPAQLAPVLWLRIRKAVAAATARDDRAVRAIAVADATSPTREAGRCATRVALVWDGIDLAAGASYAARLRRLSPSSRRTLRANRPTRAAPKRWACFRAAGGARARRRRCWKPRATASSPCSRYSARIPCCNCARSGSSRAALEGDAVRRRQRALHDRDRAARDAGLAGAQARSRRAARPTNLAGDLLPVNAALAGARVRARPICEMLVALAEQLGGVPCPANRETRIARVVDSQCRRKAADTDVDVRRRALRARGARPRRRAPRSRELAILSRRRHVAARSAGSPE